MALDLVGQRFGRLIVTARINFGYGSGVQSVWDCVCDCGKTTSVSTGNLRSGHIRSCGCLLIESRLIHSGKAQITHGMTNTSEYRSWAMMNNRCSNEKSSDYAKYGAKGITVCDEWKTSFEAFYRDMGPKPTPAHSIDRRENDKGYYKDNCRWATKSEQQNNKVATKYYIFNNEKLTLPEIAKKLNLCLLTLKSRLRRGMPEEKAFRNYLFKDK